MAGMFYSLREAAGKLNKTEEEIKEIVKEGRLREFRDGPNLLFKVDEVEALMADTSITTPKEPAEPAESAPSKQQTEKDEISLEPEAEPELAPEPEAKPELAPEPESKPELAPEPEAEPELAPEPEAKPELAPEPELKSEPQAEPLLEPEVGSTEELAGGTDLTGADTALTSEGINVLGETDSDYKLTDDTMGETSVVSDKGALDSSDQGSLTSSAGEVSAPSDEVSLEDIEEDVNLDSFGSGSGLLDLSLQADDTSLGGILDEIYTPEGEQEQKIPESGSAVAVGPEEMLAEEGLGTSEVGLDVRPVAAARYVEAPPDTVSNAFGIMLILPLLTVIYTAIVVVAGFSNAKPVILEQIQGIIWYVMIAAVVASFLIIGVPFALAGKSAGPKVAKKKKVKKPKAKKKKAKGK